MTRLLSLVLAALLLAGCAGPHFKFNPKHNYLLIGEGNSNVPLAEAAGVPVEAKGCLALVIQRCGISEEGCPAPDVKYIRKTEGCQITIGADDAGGSDDIQ